MLGAPLGFMLGRFDGNSDGASEGWFDGKEETLGASLGAVLGAPLGFVLGRFDGNSDGISEGWLLGASLGAVLSDGDADGQMLTYPGEPHSVQTVDSIQSMALLIRA